MDDEDKMEDSTAGPIESRQIGKVSLMFNYNTIWLYCYYSFCVLPEPNWNTLNFLFINADCKPWNWQGEFIKTKCRFFQMLFTQEDCAIAMQKGSFWRQIVLFDNWSVQILGALLSARAKRMKHQWQWPKLLLDQRAWLHQIRLVKDLLHEEMYYWNLVIVWI